MQKGQRVVGYLYYMQRKEEWYFNLDILNTVDAKVIAWRQIKSMQTEELRVDE